MQQRGKYLSYKIIERKCRVCKVSYSKWELRIKEYKVFGIMPSSLEDLEAFFCPFLGKVISKTSNLWYNNTKFLILKI